MRRVADRVFMGLVLLAVLGGGCPILAVPAFPGAEGYGANTAGGRGGTVYHVTNLNDSGPGSLRAGVGTANRTIVFDVSGTINLLSDLKVTKSNLTIAGQTAPGDGLALKGRLFSIQDTRDVVVRYLRCRAGDVNCTTNPATTFQDDSFHFVNATNCIADHVSASWSVDEALSVTWSTNVTVQWCVISESLKNSCHPKGAHGYGSLLRYGAGGLSFHHNLYAAHDSRNPRPGDNIHLDFVNNVVFNWGSACGYNANDAPDNPAGFTNVLNYVSNYFIAGPSTSGSLNNAFDSGVTNAASCQVHQAGNLLDGNRNGVLDGVNTGWGMFGSPYTQLASRFPAPPVTTDPAPVAFQRVLAFAGAAAARDAADQRVIANVRRQTGAIIDSQEAVGGWPALVTAPAPRDTDQDGIPDYWELAMGWNMAVANNNHTNADGYTDLEWYLNWRAGPRAVCDRNGAADVSLRTLTGNSTNLTFIVANGTNGTVTLAADGFTARFVAAPDFTGFASFSFQATDPATAVTFGPVAVAVLITTTNALPANTPPALAPITNRTVTAGATLVFTNAATDAEAPPQTLTFALYDPPDGATLNSTNGVFVWRPTLAQSGTSNRMEVVVTDSGTPSLSATQAFIVVVHAPARPQFEPAAFQGNRFGGIISGDPGPDYFVQASTNLADWTSILALPSPMLPVAWSDTNADRFDRRFYRVKLGP